jgi:hypothetical protein
MDDILYLQNESHRAIEAISHDPLVLRGSGP